MIIQYLKKRRGCVFLFLIFALLWPVLWLANRKVYPLEIGTDFSVGQAQWLGFDPKLVYTAMLDDLKPSFIRIAAPWTEVEKTKHIFSFDMLDWQMQEAQKRKVKVILVVGQKVPRWPECYIPSWAQADKDAYKQELLHYVQTVIKRYKDHPALEMWQIENEPFIISNFGECAHFQEDMVEEEVHLAREIDTTHKILVTDGGEFGLWKRAGKLGDIFGTTVYRLVETRFASSFSYGFLPPSYYRWKGRLAGIETHKLMVSELQAEPWFGKGNPFVTPVEVQKQKMSPERIIKHVDFASRIGVSRVNLWGVEWWYFMKEKHGDDSYWNTVKELIKNSQIEESR